MSHHATSQNKTYDVLTVLHDNYTSTALTASTVGQVEGSAKVLDLGAELPSDALAPEMLAEMIVDVATCDVTNGDEYYQIIVEASSNSDFSSDVVALAILPIGDQAVIPGAVDVDNGVGRYTLPISTQRNGTNYRYLRVNMIVAGTTPSIQYLARLGTRN